MREDKKKATRVKYLGGNPVDTGQDTYFNGLQSVVFHDNDESIIPKLTSFLIQQVFFLSLLASQWPLSYPLRSSSRQGLYSLR